MGHRGGECLLRFESGRWLHHVVGPTDREVSDEVVMSELWLRLAISNAGEDEGLSVCG